MFISRFCATLFQESISQEIKFYIRYVILRKMQYVKKSRGFIVIKDRIPILKFNKPDYKSGEIS